MYSIRKAARRRPKKKIIAAELLERIGEANRIALGIERHGVAERLAMPDRELRTKPLARENSQ